MSEIQTEIEALTERIQKLEQYVDSQVTTRFDDVQDGHRALPLFHLERRESAYRDLNYWFSAPRGIGCRRQQKYEQASPAFVRSPCLVCFIQWFRANAAVGTTNSRQTDLFDESAAGRRNRDDVARHGIRAGLVWQGRLPRGPKMVA